MRLLQDGPCMYFKLGCLRRNDYNTIGLLLFIAYDEEGREKYPAKPAPPRQRVESIMDAKLKPPNLTFRLSPGSRESFLSVV